MTKLDRLGGILREVEAPLGSALQEHSPYLQWLDSDLQLSYSQCGIATAALQLYLSEQCGVATERRRAILPMLSVRRGPDDPVVHVTLSTEDKRTICPTYTQFFGLIGLSARLAQQFPDMKELLPDHKIALFNEAEELEFGAGVASEALSIRDRVSHALSVRALDFFSGKPALLKRADDAVVIATYQSIWQSQNYAPYTVESQAAAYGDGRFEECVGKIVDAI